MRTPGFFITFGSMVVTLSAWSQAGNPFISGPEVELSDVVSHMRATGRMESLKKVITAIIEQKVASAPVRVMLQNTLLTKIDTTGPEELKRFPNLPLNQLNTMRALLKLNLDESKVTERNAVHTALEIALGVCDTPVPAAPTEILPEVPEFKRGSVYDPSINDCDRDRSVKLASLLSSLALSNGSAVGYRGATYTKPEELLAALQRSGHRLTLQSQRTIANFTAVFYNDKVVRWPGWLDTGRMLKDGRKLRVPMGHSQFVFHLKGPLLGHARISFYHGVDGVGFFPELSLRPRWTGLRNAYEINSDTPAGLADILKTAALSGTLLARTVTEAKEYASNLPDDGYGYLGVCNDSVATIEFLTRGRQITSFPLLRAPEFATYPPRNDGLDEALRLLPADTGLRVPRVSTLTRILASSPPLDSPEVYDEELRADLKQVAVELNRDTSDVR